MKSSNTSSLMLSLSTATPSQSKITRSKRCATLFLRHTPAALQRRVPRLAVEPPLVRGAARLGLLARFGHDQRARYELAQALERRRSVLLLAAKLLRLDH